MAEKLDLDRLEKVRAAATQGEWRDFHGRIEGGLTDIPVIGLLHPVPENNVFCYGTLNDRTFVTTFDPPTIDQLISELKDARAIETATDTIIDGWRWHVEQERKRITELEAEVARLKASGIIGTGKRDDPAG